MIAADNPLAYDEVDLIVSTPPQIRTLEPADRVTWLRLWRGYQAFYEVDIAESVSAVTWDRLLDPAEPMAGALALVGDTAVGLVHWIFTARPGRSAMTSICRISSLPRMSGAAASGVR